jgi:Zn-dependent protease
MPNLLLTILIVFGALQLLTFWLQVKRLMQLPLQCPSYEPIGTAPNPSDALAALWAGPIGELQALGFQPCGWFQARKMLALSRTEAVQWLYHPATDTYAELGLKYPADAVDLFQVGFYTFGPDRQPDRQLLLTLNALAHSVIGQIPQTILQDCYAPTLQAQWQHHCDGLDRWLARSVDRCDQSRSGFRSVTDFLNTLEQHHQRYFEQLIQTRQIRPVRAQFRLRGGAAIQTVWTLGQARRSVAQRLAARPPGADLPIGLEVESFWRQREMEQSPGSRSQSLVIFLLSLLLFIAAARLVPQVSAVLTDSRLVAVIFVLLLHEAGHYLAMRQFGYRDLSLFFLPLLGAAVTGRKENASLSEKIIVLLAGPLPGLVLGMGLELGLRGLELPTGLEDGLRELSGMLIVLNLLNLLPIFPLDGGKIAHHLWFARYPYADVAFKIVAVGLLVLLGWDSPIGLPMAFVVALSIPMGFRSAQLDRQLRTAGPNSPPSSPPGLPPGLPSSNPPGAPGAPPGRPGSPPGTGTPSDPNGLLTAIFEQIARSGYGQKSFSKRYLLAKDLLERQQEVRSGGGQRLLLSGIYGLSLLGGLTGTALALLPSQLVEPALSETANPEGERQSSSPRQRHPSIHRAPDHYPE